jgi:hypothetical protein
MFGGMVVFLVEKPIYQTSETHALKLSEVSFNL